MFLEFLYLYIYNLPNATEGLDAILVQTMSQSNVSGIGPMLLFFVYMVVFLGGVSLQSSRQGFADYPMWSVVGSISAFIIALLMSVIEGLIRLDVLSIIIVITIFSGVWLFLDRKQSEV